MSARSGTVVLLDIDNTLIDHDRLKQLTGDEVRAHGHDTADFWGVYERIRLETGIVDFLRTARNLGQDVGELELGNRLERFLWEFPFHEILLPDTATGLESIFEQAAAVAVLCDGEPAFQRRKLERIGVLERLDHVFVFQHKEHHFHEVEARFAGERYVLFDDKPRILAAAKEHFGSRVTTVHVHHGHYATGEHRADHVVQAVNLPRAVRGRMGTGLPRAMSG